MKILLTLSDSELIESLQAGHEKAFEILIQRYVKDLRSEIQRYTKDHLLTEYLSQDILIKMYTSLQQNKYNEQAKFLPWALRITRNLCIDYLRKKARFQQADKVLHDDCLFTTLSQSAESRLAAKQQEQLLQVFIKRLPDEQQSVVYYRFFEELSFKEIAELMNTSVNTSLGRMRYGLAHLRRLISNTPSYL